MIYHEKTTPVQNGAAERFGVYRVSAAAEAAEVNHRPVRAKGRLGPQMPSLFDKVKAYKDAAEVRALGLYPYFRTISSAAASMARCLPNRTSSLKQGIPEVLLGRARERLKCECSAIPLY